MEFENFPLHPEKPAQHWKKKYPNPISQLKGPQGDYLFLKISSNLLMEFSKVNK